MCHKECKKKSRYIAEDRTTGQLWNIQVIKNSNECART